MLLNDTETMQVADPNAEQPAEFSEAEEMAAFEANFLNPPKQ